MLTPCTIAGTDLEQYLPKNFGLPENSPFLEKSPPNTAKTTLKPKTHSVRSAIMKVCIMNLRIISRRYHEPIIRLASKFYFY